jgi:uncharacterized protein
MELSGNPPVASTDNTPIIDNTSSAKKRQGFACLSAEVRKAISSKGGKAAHAMGKAHCFTSEEAQKAGRIGGKISHANLAAKKAALQNGGK